MRRFFVVSEGTGLAAHPSNFAALIEVILNVSPDRVIGDEVELLPERPQFVLAFAENRSVGSSILPLATKKPE